MDAYIVRQPIMNSEQTLEAYEVVYKQDSSMLYSQEDSPIASAIIEFFNNMDDEHFLNGKIAFLTFTPSLMMRNIPHLFNPKKIVVQIDGSVLVHPDAKAILSKYKEMEFKIAILNFNFTKRFLDILPIVDILKIDFSEDSERDIKTRIDIAKQYGIKISAYNINTSDDRARAEEFGFDYYQGRSIAEMVRSKIAKPEHLQSNFFRLISAISCDTPDYDEITQAISLDVTLTLALLRIVNSAYFALPNRVKDIKQALTLLGVYRLKHWIYLLSFDSDGGMTDELIKVSFTRATLCQELSHFVKELPLSESEAYMLGMFSTLDVLLKVSMEDTVKNLPINEEIKIGLTTNIGKCAQLLGLCIAYEGAQWTRMTEFAEELEIPVNVIAEKYIEVIAYVNKIWEDLSKPFS